MDLQSAASGPASEALNLMRTFNNSPERSTLPPRNSPSLAPLRAPLYSPDTKSFHTPAAHGPSPASGEATSVGTSARRSSAPGDHPDQDFQDHMNQYVTQQLRQEWDNLLSGSDVPDIRNGADVYRAVRHDLRSMALALKASFGLVVDNRHFAGGAGRGSAQQLQPCIAELKSVAKDMASATRLATDNYNLQVELTLQKHASQYMLAQMHEQQLQLMAKEEELEVLRSAAQRACVAESSASSLRSLNQALQVEAQNASGELLDGRRRERELEDQLGVQREAVAALEARLREMELFEDHGPHTPPGEGRTPSDGGSAATALAAALVGAPHPHPDRHQHHHADGVAGHRRASGSGGDGSDGGVAAAHARVHDLPPELRRLLGRLLRRRDSEAAKLREDNAQLQQLLATARAAAAAAGAGPTTGAATTAASTSARATAAAANGQEVSPTRHTSQLGQGQQERRVSADSWQSDDGFDWGSGPAEEAYQHHHHHQQQEQEQQQQQQPDGRPSKGEQPAADGDGAAATASAMAELAVARETIARLRLELAEAQAQLAEQRQELQADAEEAVETQAALLARLADAEAEGAVHVLSAKRAEGALAEARRQLDVLQQLQQERDEQERDREQMAQRQSRDGAAAAAAVTEHLSMERDSLAEALADAQRSLTVEELRRTLAVEEEAAAGALVLAELQGRLEEAEARERQERQAREAAVKDLEGARQKLLKLQKDMNDVRAETTVAKFESTAASRDTKAANSEKLKAQREMEDALERMRAMERTRAELEAKLATAEAEQRRLEAALAEAEAAAVVAAIGAEGLGGAQEADEASAEAESRAAAAEASEAEARKALAEAGRELAEGQRRLTEERQAQGRLVRELEATRAELEAVKADLDAVTAASEERLAQAEAQLARVTEEAEEASVAAVAAAATAAGARAAGAASAQQQEQQRQQQRELLRLQERLAEAEARASDLEAQADELRRSAEDAELAAEATSTLLEAAQAEADAARAALAARGTGAEAAAEATVELKQLRARLAEVEAAAAKAAAPTATTTAAASSPVTSASSSDAGVSRANSPEHIRARAEAALARGDAATADQGQGQGRDGAAAVAASDLDDEDDAGASDDVVMMQSRCRALRGELGLVRSRLAALLEVSEAAAAGRLADALDEARAAAKDGEVTNDEEFWSHSNEVHSLYALVGALRATSLHHGPTYGDTCADGAGSLVGSTPGQLAACQRRKALAAMRLRCGQVGELLAEASALARLPRCESVAAGAAAAATTTPGAGWRSGAPSSGGCGGGMSRQTSAAAPPPPARPAASLLAAAPATGAAARGGADGRALGLEHSAAAYLSTDGRGDYDSFVGMHMSGISDGGEGLGPAAALAAASQGHHQPHTHHQLHSSALVANSSFTSGTGSSLADGDDNDFASLQNMYELPPMATPPKFDFSDLAN